MTEQEWLACTDPTPMVEFLRGKASARKLCLFACACCRQIWHLMYDGCRKEAVTVAERLADRNGRRKELTAARNAAGAASERGFLAWATARAACHAASVMLVRTRVGMYAETAALDAANAAAGCNDYHDPAWIAARVGQADLLRDIIGNPFRQPTINPAWLTWNNSLVQRLAQMAYDERALPEGTLDPTRLAVLADALEDAGCTDAVLTEHLRERGLHVRGCWAIDLLTAREGRP